jgi:hypothetical protein
VTLFAPDGVMGSLLRWRRRWLDVVPRSPRELDDGDGDGDVLDDTPEPVEFDVELDAP